MEETATPQPCAINERNGVEHQRVALPAPHRVPHILGLDSLLWVMLAVVGRNHAIFTVSASCIASRIEQDNIFVRLEDASRWALPRDSQGLARHDRVVLVRPHVKLLNFVPILRLINWTT